MQCTTPDPFVTFDMSVSQEVLTGVVYSLTALYIVSMTIFGGITAVLCWKIHTLKRKGNPLITLCACIAIHRLHRIVIKLLIVWSFLFISGFQCSKRDTEKIQFPPNPGDPTLSDPTPSGGHSSSVDSTPSGGHTPFGDPTPSHDPTTSGDLTSIQLQPNPSYCSVEMSHQQLMSSRLENDPKYVNL